MNIEYTSSKTYTNSEVLFDIVQWNYIYIYTNYLRQFTKSVNCQIMGTYKIQYQKHNIISNI